MMSVKNSHKLSDFDNDVFSVELWLKHIKDKKELSQNEKNVLRRLLRKGEIKKVIHKHYSCEKLKVNISEAYIGAEYINLLLGLVLKIYKNEKDLKLLNGALKISDGVLKFPVEYTALNELHHTINTCLEELAP